MALGTPTLATNINQAGYATLVLSCTGATRGSIRRITPAGSVPVRGASSVDLSSGFFFATDFEIPQSVELQYYAEVTDGGATATTPISVTPGLNRGGDWIAPLGAPLNGMLINVEKVDDRTTEASQDVVKVLNRADPVVVTFGRHTPSYKINFITLTDEERIQFTSILSTGRTVLFQPRIGYGYEEPAFLSVGNVVEKRPSTAGGEPVRVWECDVTETAAPPPQFTIPVGSTWQEKVLAGNNWNYWATAGTTWLDFTGAL